jgi:hypothetical protein
LVGGGGGREEGKEGGGGSWRSRQRDWQLDEEWPWRFLRREAFADSLRAMSGE